MTIYDIAKEAGVSASTVSRVVNNKAGVKESTKKKILKLLKKNNYIPNETARGLVKQSTKIIGILISDIRQIHYTDGAYIIENEFAKLGYCCIILNTGKDDVSKAEYIEILNRRRVDGAVLIGSTYQSDMVAEAIQLHLRDIPIVIANGYLDLPNVYGVIADEYEGVINCVKLLNRKGHKNLAFVIDNYTPSNVLKRDGFVAAVKATQARKTPLVYECQNSLDGAYDTTRRIMKEHPDVDGIIYAVDLLAAGGVRALVDLDISIPDQVGIIGIDNSIYSEISNPKITSLDNRLMDVSMAASSNLMDALQEKKVMKKILVYSTIVERETT